MFMYRYRIWKFLLLEKMDIKEYETNSIIFSIAISFYLPRICSLNEGYLPYLYTPICLYT